MDTAALPSGEDVRLSANDGSTMTPKAKITWTHEFGGEPSSKAETRLIASISA